MNIYGDITYTTKDLMQAALLLATGHKLHSNDWSAGVCFFIFEDSPACEKTVADYYNNKIRINAKKLFDALQTAKSIINSR